MTVVGQAGTATDALRETSALKPDVVLVDLNIPDRDGIELLGALRVQLPHAKLLVLSGYDDEFRVAEALRAGAQGYLVKTSRLEEVVDGIRRISSGGAPLSPAHRRRPWCVRCANPPGGNRRARRADAARTPSASLARGRRIDAGDGSAAHDQPEDGGDPSRSHLREARLQERRRADEDRRPHRPHRSLSGLRRGAFRRYGRAAVVVVVTAQECGSSSA